LNENDLVVGRNPVLETLRGGRPINKLLLAKGVTGTAIKEIKNLAREKRIPVQQVERVYLDKMLPQTVHQGIIAFAAAKEYISVDDILARAGEEDCFLVLVNKVTDPRNLGAIMRTAEAVGVHGVIIPSRRSASLTQSALKAAAGALEHLPAARVTNMAQTIRYLQQKNIWVVGADACAPQIFWDVKLDGPIALVVGGEDTGLGTHIRQCCDLLVRIPMTGLTGSLNASVAAAVLAYEVFRQRRMTAHERISGH